MGHDEHGPAYPEPKVYRCPICRGDENRYMTCEYPGCPDGRDRGHPHARSVWTDPAWERKTEYETVMKPTDPPLWLRLIMVVFVVGALLWLFSTPALAMNHGFNPDDKTVQWMERKMRPDQPEQSCCGAGDGYPVARYKKNDDHTWTVWLADGSALKYPDGTVRTYFDMSIPIIVPDNKVNKSDDDIDNPTDVGWIFMRANGSREPGAIYCLIIHDEGN